MGNSVPTFADDKNNIEYTSHLAKALFEKSADLIDSKFGEGYAKKNPNLLAATITMQEHLYTSLQSANDK